MTIYYPEGLPLGLYSGRSYQIVSPLQRSELSSGRARQRRRFTSVPEMAQVSWLFNDAQGQAFEAWWRDQLIDGSMWFEMPLDTPLGLRNFTARFTDIYSGPSRVGPTLWSYTGQLEMRERAVLNDGYGVYPDIVINSDLFDKAMNIEWPLSPWQVYASAVDDAITVEWPKQ